MSDYETINHKKELPPVGQTEAWNFNFRYLFDVFHRRFRIILGVTLLSLLFGVLFLSFQKPQYTVTAAIQLNNNAFKPTAVQMSMSDSLGDSAAIQSELDIIKSAPLIRRVVTKLELQKKPEFNSALARPTLASKIKKSLKSRLGGENVGTSHQVAGLEGIDEAEVTLIKVTRAVSSRLNLRKDPLSYTVRISFTSRYPNRARVIANAIAEEYMIYQIESDTTVNREAGKWLSERVGELRQQVQKSEQAVQKFSEEHNLFELDGKTLDDQQISELNAQLVMERTAYAEAAARLSHAQRLLKSSQGIDSIREVLSSGLIQNLREQEAELLREQSELSGHFGPQHPAMNKITDEIYDLRKKINSEIDKIIQGLENEVAVSRARKQSLTSQLSQLSGKLGKSTNLEIQLSELRRDAEANRILYESFLAQLKQTEESQSLQQARAKFISKAEYPLRPSAPNKKLILAFFMMIGAFSGATAALVLEAVRQSFTSPEQIEDYLGMVNIGIVPEMNNLSDVVSSQKSSSIYAEALQNILASIKFQNRKNLRRSIMVISALPQEGKGWMAISLARAAAQSGKKVLLVDCDLHRPMVSNTFSIKAKHTLNDFLDGSSLLKDIVNVDRKTGMHYISSSPDHRNIQRLLESNKMKQMIEAAHNKYDLVIMDSPPVIGMSDVMFLSQLADTAVLAVRWSSTPRHIVQKALQTLSRMEVDLLGAVLTRVPLKQYKEFKFGGRAFFKRYHAYYDAPKSYTAIAGNVLKIRSSRSS